MYRLATKDSECQLSAKKLTGNTAIGQNTEKDQKQLETVYK